MTGWSNLHYQWRPPIRNTSLTGGLEPRLADGLVVEGMAQGRATPTACHCVTNLPMKVEGRLVTDFVRSQWNIRDRLLRTLDDTPSLDREGLRSVPHSPELPNHSAIGIPDDLFDPYSPRYRPAGQAEHSRITWGSQFVSQAREFAASNHRLPCSSQQPCLAAEQMSEMGLRAVR